MQQVAKVLKTNAASGDVVLDARDLDLSALDPKEPLFIEFDGLPVPFFVESISGRGSSKYVVHLTDVDSQADAEEIVGRAVYADVEFEEEEDEDFSGWTLYDRERRVGEISGMEPIPGNPCLIVGEALVPLNEDFLLEADPEKKILRLDLPEGLV